MKRFIPFTLAFALALPATLLGQDYEEETGQLYQVTTWNADPASSQGFEEAVKLFVSAAEKANSPYKWAFWQKGSQYMIVYPVDAFAYFDDPGQFMRSLAGTPGEADVEKAMGMWPNLHMTVVSDEMAELKEDWSYMVESFDMETMTAAHFDIMWTKPNTQEAWDQLNKDWVTFFRDLGHPYPYNGHSVRFGDTGRTVYVTFIDNLADYYGKNDLMTMIEAKGMGERWEGFLEQLGKTVRSWDHYDMTYRRDMSYWPMEEGATN
jgi:hypothetical protein